MGGPVHAECEAEIARLKAIIAKKGLDLGDQCPVTLIDIGVNGRKTTPCAFNTGHRGRHSFEGATCP